jgi:chemotaxis family two-component system response regulator Rcp1
MVVNVDRPIEVLLVEDSPTDVLLTREALNEGRARHNLHVVADGIEALAFLKQRGGYADVPRPDLILLDLNLPRKDGRELLADVKHDPALKDIPVIVLTTSLAEDDVRRAYGSHANCYIVKPVDFDRFAEVVRSIELFWFSVVILPPGEKA